MGHYKKIVFDNFFLAVQFLFGGLTVFYVSPMIIKIIGVYDYGKLAVFLSLVTYMSVIIQYSFNMTGPKLIAENSDKKEYIFNVILSAKGALFLLVTFLFFVYFFINHEKYSLVYLLFLIMPFSWVLNSAWFLQYNGKFLISSVCSILGSIATFIFAYFFLKKSDGYAVAIMCLVLSAAINGLLTFIFSVWNIDKIRILKPFGVIKDGRDIFISQMISALYTMSGVLIVSYFYGSAQSGVYAAIERFMNLFISLGILTHVAAYPKLTVIFNKDFKKYRGTVLFVVGVYTLFSLGILLGLFLFEAQIENYIFGSQYEDAYKVLYSAAFYIFFGIYGPVITGYLNLINESSKIIKINISITIISMLLGGFLLRFLGSEGWLLGLGLAQIINVIYFIRIFFRRSSCVG
ncbi:oligosaccharide flippase family protein [Pantoea sp. BS_4]|uniref:oligosaccharide flippase family protein n=1 Tax=unclassified Pantoea TaxID=2630326 RepID=UPI0035C095A1